MARQFLTQIDMSGNRITNVGSPVSPNDAVRLADLNSAVEGLNWKDSCRVATQANINLSSPGASIDGVSLSSGDRVLVRNQTAQAENGIYIWNGASVAMTRSADANTADELEQAVVVVEEGTDAGTTWRQQSVNFTLETGSVVWASFGTSAPAASETTSGIARLATQSDVDAGTDDSKIVTPLKLANWSGRVRKHAVNVGDGTNTSYTVTHNFGTRDVSVEVFLNSGNYDTVDVDVRRTSTNAIQLVFASAPTTNAYRVVIVG